MAKKAKKAAKTKAKSKAPRAKAKAQAPAKAAGPGLAVGFLEAFEREHKITLRILASYPGDKLDLKPHAKCKTARDLAWMFVMEQGATEKALTTGFDFSAPMTWPPAPATLEEIAGALDQGHQKVAAIMKGMSDGELLKTTKFPTAPKTMSDVPRLQLAWMFLCDQIHHRGQFSVYLRMADGKVPSIYGPTADEPWN